ncbi:MAG: hypothetical protein ABI333_01205 [bacterium]
MTDQGYPPQGYPPQGQPPQSYPPQGYPPQGYPPQGYPPQGYPPQGYPPPGYPPGYGMPLRSAIPKVMGILMIIFGSLGLLSALINLASGGGGLGMQSREVARAFQEMKQFQMIANLIGLPMAVLQLMAGIWAVKYKRHAQLLSNTYAGLSIAQVIGSLILVYSWLMPVLERELPGHAGENVKAMITLVFVIGGVIGMVWPVLILILMNRPNAKVACVN